jgi:hypothetical protein
MNLDRLTDSHVELNSLDNTQECLNNSHHKITATATSSHIALTSLLFWEKVYN